MASAKFLEEALNTDVDESAVSALVGSLETQLVTTTPTVSNQQGTSVTVNQNHMNSAISNGGTVSTQKHGVPNGGSESMNIILNSDANKVISGGTLQSAIPTSVVNTVVASLQSGVPPSGFINQVTSNIGLVQSNLTNLNKSQEAVKLVYPSSSQAITTSVGVNRVTYPNNQTISSLPNGNLGLTSLASQTVLNASTTSVQSVVSQSYSQAGSNVTKVTGVIGMDQNKPTGTALVIKSSSNNHGAQGAPLAQGVVTVPMTVNTPMTLTGTHVNTAAIASTTAAAVPGVVTIPKPMTQAVGTPQSIIPNLQILNVNAIRTGTPTQPGQKTLPPRVMTIGPQMVGARPGQTGQLTLQALQGLQPGTQGHLLLKTENGQYQLIRVGPATTTPTAAIASNNAANAAFRVQSVPAGSAAAGTVQAQVPALTTTQTTTPTPAMDLVGLSSPPPTLAHSQAGPQEALTTPRDWLMIHPPGSLLQNCSTIKQAQPQRQGADTTKEKCRKFLANLLELSSREPKAVERNVRTLIQELVDTKVEPEEFCDRLEKLLNASPQPCLIGFLKKSLPLLRQAMVTKELVIEGIRPPPHSVLFSTPTVVQTQQTQAQSLQQGAQTIRPQVQMTTTPQMRVIAHPVPTTVPGTPTRPGTQSVQRFITPMRGPNPVAKVGTTSVVGIRQQTPTIGTTAAGVRVAATPIRPPISKPTTSPIMLKSPTLAAGIKPTQLLTKATIATRPPGSPSIAAGSIKAQISPAPSLLLKAVTTAKEKEKKSFSSAGYTGDDDINDVAAMGGVNLAEETQRILGSTEFVGTQIRSCKDDIYLHTAPLMQKISQIATRHGLEEPGTDVAALISHATQERLKNLVEKLAVIAEHRIDFNKADPRYEVSQDVRGQLKFLEELDRVERKRHEEQERELLLRAAKSRSKSEDPEQAKLKAKAKEMQRAEMEELRQREANLTALQAIGPRKKPRIDGPETSTASSGQNVSSSSNSNNTMSRTQMARPRLKRVTIRDLLFLLESEKEMCHSNLLYRAYLYNRYQ